jgi:hypothetical protein
MVLAIDVPTAVLIFGVVVLCVTTAISSLALPQLTLRRWRRRSPMVTFPVLERRVVTGRPAAIPRLGLPPAPRQQSATTDVRANSEDLREAERLVEHLLEHDPSRLAALLTRWIDADHELESTDA